MSSHSQLLTQTPAQSLVPKHLEELIRSVKILIVDDDQHMRKVIRTMLTAIGVREIYDTADGMSGLHSVCVTNPDIVILDWKMPEVGGAEFIRTVRSPASFPVPNVPIIVLTGYGERSFVVEAMQLGANEFLLKPVSTKALFDRLASVLARPRPMVKIGDYYGPKPRKNAFNYEPPYNVQPADKAPRQDRLNYVNLQNCDIRENSKSSVDRVNFDDFVLI